MSEQRRAEQTVEQKTIIEQVRVVNITLLIIAVLTVITTVILTIGEMLAPMNQLWQTGPILGYGALCIVMWRLNNAQRVRAVSVIFCLLLFVLYFPILHLSGGYASPTAAFALLFFPVLFVVVLDRNDYLWVTGSFIGCFILLALIESFTAGSSSPQAPEVIQGVVLNVMLAIVELLMLNWVIGRLRTARTTSALQLAQLAQLNVELVARQQLQQQAAGDVSFAAQRIGEAIGVQAQGAQETAATVAQVSSSAEQLDLEAKLIAGSAQQVNELVSQANTEIQASQQLIEQVEAAVQLVHTDVSVAVERTTKLGEHVREITTILQLLEGITKETHILSLNAAIEAASAEDTMVGRRFAIVAQEVEELASRAERATGQVRVIINQVGQASNATALATVESMSETERSVKMLQQATEAAKRLSAMAADINIWADSILQSTQQQEQSSEQVAAALQQIANLARQNAASEQQLQAVARQLNTLVGELQPDNAALPNITDSDTATPPQPTSARPTTRLQVAG